MSHLPNQETRSDNDLIAPFCLFRQCPLRLLCLLARCKTTNHKARLRSFVTHTQRRLQLFAFEPYNNGGLGACNKDYHDRVNCTTQQLYETHRKKVLTFVCVCGYGM